MLSVLYVEFSTRQVSVSVFIVSLLINLLQLSIVFTAVSLLLTFFYNKSNYKSRI